jgi:hypothetical protein
MSDAEQKPADDTAPKTCGIIMPISAIDGCTAEHWQDVLAIHSAAIRSAGFDPQLVSDANEVGVIQKRIVENLYTNPIAVCDVSGKNPNVMLELGMRLAFDKPVIIVQDDKTTASFDTSPIEYVSYPRDLRHNKIEAFKEKLAAKVKATYEKSADPGYTTFLKHFGTFSVAKVETKEVGKEERLIERLEDLTIAFTRLSQAKQTGRPTPGGEPRMYRIELMAAPLDRSDVIGRLIESGIILSANFASMYELIVTADGGVSAADVRKAIGSPVASFELIS